MTIVPVLEAGCGQAALEQSNAEGFKSCRAGEMAQWAKVLSARPPNPKSKPETHMSRRELISADRRRELISADHLRELISADRL